MIAIYARVSTEEQARKGYSLQDQLRECARVAGNTEEIREYIDDGVSGEFLDRPALTRLRRDVAEGLISKVVCLNPDRLSRRLMDQLIITEEIEKKAKLVFVDGEYENTPEGRLFYQMRGSISEFEKAKINERMSRGRREKARQGKVVKDYRIYGYDYDPNTCSLVINPYEEKIVKLIFDLFTGRDNGIQGINGIARFLTQKGIPTKRGAPVWHRQVVRQILQNRAYIGEFYQNRWNTEGMLGNRFRKPEERIPLRERPREDWILVPCPPIIDKEVFFYAQKLLEESRRRWSGTSRHNYMLSGLLRCGICGNTMTGLKAKNWGKETFMYTDLKTAHGSKHKGCGNRVKAEDLEKRVWNWVFELLRKENVEAEQPDEDETFKSFEAAELERVERRLGEIRKERRNIVDLIATSGDLLGGDGMEEVKERMKALKMEERKLLEKLSEITSKMDGKSLDKNSGDLAREAWEYYLFKAPDEISLEDKKELTRYLVREIRVYKDRLLINGF